VAHKIKRARARGAKTINTAAAKFAGVVKEPPA
jgi:hypothetical protein